MWSCLAACVEEGALKKLVGREDKIVSLTVDINLCMQPIELLRLLPINVAGRIYVACDRCGNTGIVWPIESADVAE